MGNSKYSRLDDGDIQEQDIQGGVSSMKPKLVAVVHGKETRIILPVVYVDNIKDRLRSAQSVPSTERSNDKGLQPPPPSMGTRGDDTQQQDEENPPTQADHIKKPKLVADVKGNETRPILCSLENQDPNNLKNRLRSRSSASSAAQKPKEKPPTQAEHVEKKPKLGAEHVKGNETSPILFSLGNQDRNNLKDRLRSRSSRTSATQKPKVSRKRLMRQLSITTGSSNNRKQDKSQTIGNNTNKAKLMAVVNGKECRVILPHLYEDSSNDLEDRPRPPPPSMDTSDDAQQEDQEKPPAHAEHIKKPKLVADVKSNETRPILCSLENQDPNNLKNRLRSRRSSASAAQKPKPNQKPPTQAEHIKKLKVVADVKGNETHPILGSLENHDPNNLKNRLRSRSSGTSAARNPKPNEKSQTLTGHIKKPRLVANVKGNETHPILSLGNQDPNNLKDRLRSRSSGTSAPQKPKPKVSRKRLMRQSPITRESGKNHEQDESYHTQQANNANKKAKLMAVVHDKECSVILPHLYDDSTNYLEDRVRAAHAAIKGIWTADDTQVCGVESALLAHRYYMKHIPSHDPQNKKKNIRLLVLGESHAATQAAVTGLEQRSGPASDLHFGHLNLVHCLSYGEPQLLRFPVDLVKKEEPPSRSKNNKHGEKFKEVDENVQTVEEALKCQIRSINSGTLQFWKLLSTLAGELDDCDLDSQDAFDNAFPHLMKTIKKTTTVADNKTESAPQDPKVPKKRKKGTTLHERNKRNEQRVLHKANILKKLAERRIVFADVSPVSIYLGGGKIVVKGKSGNEYWTPANKLSSKVRDEITRSAWDEYAVHLVRELQPQYLLILGAGVYKAIAQDGRLKEFDNLGVGEEEARLSPPSVSTGGITKTSTTTKLFPPILHPSANQCMGGKGRSLFQTIQRYAAKIVQDEPVIFDKQGQLLL